MEPLERLRESFRLHATRPFLIAAETGSVLTYAEVEERALALSREVRAAGLGPGDRAVIALENGVNLATLYIAALLSGVVVVPLTGGFGRRELRAVIELARPAAALVSEAKREPGLERVLADANVPLVELGTTDGHPAAVEQHDPADGPASIHFTSGTTGLPRGVGHRLRDFIDNAERFAAATGLDHESRFHAALPMTYMAGYYNLLLLPATIGASVVIDRAFDARSVIGFWESPIRDEANVLWLVPTMVAMLLKVAGGSGGRRLLS